VSGYILIRDGIMWAFNTDSCPLPGYAGRHGFPTLVMKVGGKKIHPGDENDDVAITFISDDCVIVKMPGEKVIERSEREWAPETKPGVVKAKNTPVSLKLVGTRTEISDIWEQAKTTGLIWWTCNYLGTSFHQEPSSKQLIRWILIPPPSFPVRHHKKFPPAPRSPDPRTSREPNGGTGGMSAAASV